MAALHSLRAPAAAGIGSRQQSHAAAAVAAAAHRPLAAPRPLQPQQQQHTTQLRFRPPHPHDQQQQQWRGRGQLMQRRAGPVDAPPVWTLDQIAGLAFGVVMLAFYFGSQQVDVIIAKQQRRQLGLCEACGGLNDPATCSKEGCPMRGAPSP